MRVKRSIVSLFICLAICFSFLPANVFATEDNIINSVVIEGVSLPVAGARPVNEVTLGNGETRCHVSYVLWRDVEGFSVNDEFVAGQTYRLQVNLETEKGSNYQFSNPLNIICNGSTKIVESYSGVVYSDDKRDDLSVILISFIAANESGVPISPVIDSVVIEGFSLPVAGARPVNVATLGNGETRCHVSYVTWRDSDGFSVNGVFVAGQTYRLQVNLETKKNSTFQFANPLNIICDGSTRIVENYSTVTYSDDKRDDLSVIFIDFFVPEIINYNIWVDNVRVTSANMYDVLNDGTVSYNPETNTMTLNGAQITNADDGGAGIYSSGSLKINVIGDSLIELDGSIRAHGILTYGDLEITGPGNLYISVGNDDSDGIESYGTVTLSSSGNLSIMSFSYGIYTDHSSLILTGSGELNILCHFTGVMLWGDDSQMFLNGSNSKISIEVIRGGAAVLNGDTQESSVVGTSIDNYTVEGSPDSNNVVYTLNVETGVAGFCERLYTCCLGRASEPEGKEYWINALQNGATGAQAAHEFFFCPEFIDSGYSDQEYVRRLYTTFMNRVPSETELAYWSELITSGAMTRESVFWGFVGSPEWIGICESYGILPGTILATSDPVKEFATRLYTTCLGRDGEEAGITYWTNELRSGNATGRAAAHTFFFGDEFIGGNHSDFEFVARLYRTFMGREGSLEEINYWVSNVNAYGREAVFNGFASSDEFANLCNAAGINP